MRYCLFFSYLEFKNGFQTEGRVIGGHSNSRIHLQEEGKQAKRVRTEWTGGNRKQEDRVSTVRIRFFLFEECNNAGTP